MSKILELETFAGNHISSVCEEAAAKAKSTGNAVHFVFNDTHVTVQPGELAKDAELRWAADQDAAHAAWLASPEKAARDKADAEEYQRKITAHVTEPANTEDELRKAKVPWSYTKEQLVEYIQSLVTKDHDYGTCVYAMSMAAEAAFNYVSHCLGVTGFQASCADLDFIRRTRNIDGPFMLLKGADALYPQYDLAEKLAEAMQDWRSWLKEQAQKNLDTNERESVHPDVWEHWRALAGAE